jgi:hypothetical protein
LEDDVLGRRWEKAVGGEDGCVKFPSFDDIKGEVGETAEPGEDKAGIEW